MSTGIDYLKPIIFSFEGDEYRMIFKWEGYMITNIGSLNSYCMCIQTKGRFFWKTIRKSDEFWHLGRIKHFGKSGIIRRAKGEIEMHYKLCKEWS